MAKKSTWSEYGVQKSANLVSPKKFGPHKYADHDGTSDCEYGCGCWMGPCRSGGDVDPFGMCPNNPLKTFEVKYSVIKFNNTSEADKQTVIASRLIEIEDQKYIINETKETILNVGVIVWAEKDHFLLTKNLDELNLQPGRKLLLGYEYRRINMYLNNRYIPPSYDGKMIPFLSFDYVWLEHFRNLFVWATRIGEIKTAKGTSLESIAKKLYTKHVEKASNVQSTS